MSRGLGRVERFVLGWLVKAGRDQELSAIVRGAADPDGCPCCDSDWRAPKPTKATYSAVCRAVAALERKGWVHAEIHTNRLTDGRGSNRWKVLRLSVEQMEVHPFAQHLECPWKLKMRVIEDEDDKTPDLIAVGMRGRAS